MILTEKTKEDFENYVLNKELGHDSEVLISVYNQETLFIDYKDVKKTLLNALIIEWFDSVGIYIEVYRHNNRPTVQGFNSRIVRRINGYYECCTAVNTRNKAIQYAIEKANEIYNNKN